MGCGGCFCLPKLVSVISARCLAVSIDPNFFCYVFHFCIYVIDYCILWTVILSILLVANALDIINCMQLYFSMIIHVARVYIITIVPSASLCRGKVRYYDNL